VSRGRPCCSSPPGGSGTGSPRPRSPQLIHYPGTEGIEEQTSPNIGLRKYWFKLNEDYPSKSVFYFYQNELEPKGWQRMGTAEPQWARQEVKGKAHDILRSLWVSPDRLFQLELEMMSVAAPIRSGDETVSEDREPGIRVYVTLRRTLHPGIMLQRPAAEPPRAGIEVPDSDR
jgi:hypothetical protein